MRTGQDYLDGWVIDYNHFKKHHALKGATPAEVVGADKLVPWRDSWEGITRMGGEIAEPQIRDVVIEALKPGPKPKPTDEWEKVKQVAQEYHEALVAKQTKSKVPKGYKKPPVASYQAKPKPKGKKGGRGKKGMKV